MKKAVIGGIAAFLFGVLVWAVISAISGRREAWDSSLYFQAGLPVLYLGSLGLGYLHPHRSWFYGFLPFAGQFIWMITVHGLGNLWPLGLAFMTVLSIPAMIAARFGAALAKKGRSH